MVPAETEMDKNWLMSAGGQTRHPQGRWWSRLRGNVNHMTFEGNGSDGREAEEGTFRAGWKTGSFWLWLRRNFRSGGKEHDPVQQLPGVTAIRWQGDVPSHCPATRRRSSNKGAIGYSWLMTLTDESDRQQWAAECSTYLDINSITMKIIDPFTMHHSWKYNF